MDNFQIKKRNPDDKIIALAGNPNVGKSTVFNSLTGMNQHTGNWPGKTVDIAQGYCSSDKNNFVFVDIPGTYSIAANSPEEEVARNFLCFSKPDAAVIVCDATVLERNLNLVLQIREFMPQCVLCLNLMDEAKRKKIKIDTERLSRRLKMPVIETVARSKKGLKELLNALDNIIDKTNECYKITYPKEIEEKVSLLEPIIKSKTDIANSRWLSLRIIEGDRLLIDALKEHTKDEIITDEITSIISSYDRDKIRDTISGKIISEAEKICRYSIKADTDKIHLTDRKLDKIFTGKLFGIPAMIILLIFIFWLTIFGANYPSALLSDLLFSFEQPLYSFFSFLNLPRWICEMLVFGMYRVLAWVVSVMLPPMAIFFPLFTLLEDSGYLPRIAYNLDKPFKKCRACGKQALTMCMGFGCNACGVMGARIINSPRERLLAILTNSFVPCNGRFPALISITTMFFVGTAATGINSIISAVLLSGIIIFSIGMTFLSTRMLSHTVLKGVSSSFTLELPSYRMPQFRKVIVRSVFDRTLFVLGRAVSVAAPAGLIIWLFANITINGSSILNICADFLDPLGYIMGMDGIILMAFILGLPANEIVLPLILMGYMAQGNLTELSSLVKMKEILIANGWTYITAVSTIMFSLMHWPCSTTLITIKKETGSLKWTLVSAALPTLLGMASTIFFTFIARCFY